MVGTPPSETIKFGNKKIEDYMRKSPDADTILLFKLLPQMLTYEANKRIQLSRYAQTIVQNSLMILKTKL